MAGSQKQKFLALLKILYEQTDEGHPLSAPQLVGLLAGQGISCERKAIYRDVESLVSFGFDILQSTCPPGYFWGRRLLKCRSCECWRIPSSPRNSLRRKKPAR